LVHPLEFKQFTKIGDVQNLANFGRRLGNLDIRRFSASVLSVGRINTLFSLFHQEKKGTNDDAQSWNTRNLTDFRRHTQYFSFQPVIPATISYQACRLPAAALAN
jgi:hypothetical protein